MAVQIGARPDSGFDDPIGMLKDCHRRIERFLQVLSVVANRAAGRELTGEEREAVQAALHYFRVSGKRHTADEEESLFPRLRSELPGAFEHLGALESDHRSADRLHELTDSFYTSWINAGPLTPVEQQRLQDAAEELAHLYQEHIRIEEQIVFPQAAAMLKSETLAAMGQEFRSRRA